VVKDDTAAFRVDGLKELTLLTGCRRPVPRSGGAALTDLCMCDRPGVDSLPGMAQLTFLKLLRWRGETTSFLAGIPRLEMLFVEGKRQFTDLNGLEGCPSLVRMNMVDVQGESLAPLAGLTELQWLTICGDWKMRNENALDLADLARLQRLHTLVLTYAGQILSLAPLASLPALRDVRLRGTRIVDGDLEPLVRLPVNTNIVGPDD
jgi:hypothetical protein